MPSSLAKGFEPAPLLTGGADQKLLTSEDVKMRLTGQSVGRNKSRLTG